MGFEPGNQLSKLADHSRKRPCTQQLVAALNELEPETKLPRIRLLVERLIANALLGDNDAIKYIIDRIDGKVVQAHTVGGGEQGDEPVKIEVTFVRSVTQVEHPPLVNGRAK